jgi:hypothetical protein
LCAEICTNNEKNPALLKQMLKDEKEGKEWVDYMEPAWYHDIVKDKAMVNYLSQFF